MKYLLDFHSWVDLIGLSWLDLMDLLIDYDSLRKCRWIDWCFRFPFGTNYVSGVVLITGVVPALLTHLSSLALMPRDLDGCSSCGGHFDPMISPGVLQAFHFENWINCTWDPISCWTVWVSCASALLLVLLWNTRPFRIRLTMPLCGAGYALRRRIGEACHFAWSWPSWTCPPSSDNDQDWIEKKHVHIKNHWTVHDSTKSLHMHAVML